MELQIGFSIVADENMHSTTIDVIPDEKYNLELIEQQINAFLQDSPSYGPNHKVRKIIYSIQPTNLPEF